MKILGIDEAGKGPVIGPLVICGYLVDSRNLKKLERLGVKDSKLLSARKRESMINDLQKIADDFILIKMSAKEIDRMRTITNLNKLEIARIQEIINMLDADKVVIDAFEANVKKFNEQISRKVKNKKTKIITENFADKNYLEVGAASILAKVNRDNEIYELQKAYGDFGSGYPSDEMTISFLKDWIKKNKEFPDCVRKSWMTIQWIMEEVEQSDLKRFSQ
ncbi:MAG: ribonuclease HII [Candidatus Aenigmatarchaeota archaeon]